LSLAGSLHHFAIILSDVDRGIYETLELKVARHPSEAQDHLVAGVLAYCLELTSSGGSSSSFPSPTGTCSSRSTARRSRGPWSASGFDEQREG
jgi:hypothetical protein